MTRKMTTLDIEKSLNILGEIVELLYEQIVNKSEFYSIQSWACAVNDRLKKLRLLIKGK